MVNGQMIQWQVRLRVIQETDNVKSYVIYNNLAYVWSSTLNLPKLNSLFLLIFSFI